MKVERRFENLSAKELRDELFIKSTPAQWTLNHLLELETRGTSFLSGKEKEIADGVVGEFDQRISSAVKPFADEVNRQTKFLSDQIAKFKLELPKIEAPKLSEILYKYPINPNALLSESVEPVSKFVTHRAEEEKNQTEVLLKILDVLVRSSKAQVPKWVAWASFGLLVLATGWTIVSTFFN